MLLKMKQDIELLFDNVQAFKKESRPIYSNLEDQIDETINLIKLQFYNVDEKIIKNYCYRIVELKQINSTMQDIKIALDIPTRVGSSMSKKSHILIQQESKRSVASLQKKIILKLNQITELSEIHDVTYNGSEFDGICIFRLHQIYHNEVENLQQQFQQIKSFNNERFNRLYQSFSDIINDSQFLKIQEQISYYSEIINLIDEFRDQLCEIVKSKNDSILTVDRTKSLQNLTSVSKDFLDEDDHYEVKRGKYNNKLQQEEIKSKRKESSSETCINCQIF
ncbi:unnamed protein product [Paramecium octaurelia]|uniref:Uncharacterized protein n=1 Tax=Paramecium octaurelia TaxID=43137 RepID=A0A8S1WJZ1_PAROT|nr:unnamed protein product [Paramecium octaurelia]